MKEPISWTPAVPDGPDRPWTRGRRTRWWLVVPADVVAVVLVAVLVAAAGHDSSAAGVLVRDGLGSIVWGWLAAWGFTRRDGDHLESPAPEGVVVLVVVCALWLARRGFVLGAAVALHEAAPLVVGGAIALLGWRWLYGFAKAQESITPRAIQRRLDEQAEEAEQAPDAEIGTSSPRDRDL